MKEIHYKYLKEYGFEGRYQLIEKKIPCEWTFSRLGENIVYIAEVLRVDYKNEIYVVSIEAGIWNKNNAIVICELTSKELSIISFAREGVIKQHTSEKAIKKIEDMLNGR